MPFGTLREYVWTISTCEGPVSVTYGQYLNKTPFFPNMWTGPSSILSIPYESEDGPRSKMANKQVQLVK